MNDWKNFPGTDIRVALTSTKYVMTDEKVRAIDSPVCVAELNMELFGFLLNEKERLEHFLSLCTQEMMKEVNIDVEKRTVIIGDKDYPLVVFTARPAGASDFEDSFFKRWESCRMMIFEMQIILNQKTVVSVSSIYDGSEKKWTEPKRTLDPKITIIHTTKSNN